MTKQILTSASGIYQILNTVNGKCYVGSAISVRKRMRHHMSELGLRRHHSSKLQRAWDKYGKEAFEIRVLESVLFPEDLISREQHWIDALGSAKHGYNILATAGSPLGRKASIETRLKQSALKKGKPSKRGVPVALLGVEYHSLKTAAAAFGKSVTWVKTRIAKGYVMNGDIHSRPTRTEASKAKQSIVMRGRPVSPESLAKQLATKAKRSDAEKAAAVAKSVAARAAKSPEEKAETKARFIATQRLRGCAQSAESVAKMMATKASKSQDQKNAIAAKIRAAKAAQGAKRKAEIAEKTRSTVTARCPELRASIIAKTIATKAAMSADRKAEIAARMLATRSKTLAQKAGNARPTT